MADPQQPDPTGPLLESLRSTLDEWEAERQFTLGEPPRAVQFRVAKLNAMPCFRLWESVRVAAFDSLRKGNDLALGTNVITAILSLPEEVVERLRAEMFRRVWFRTPEVSGELLLAGAEDTAFELIGASAVYQVLGRCIAINFFDTLSAALSRSGAGSPISSPPPPRTSTPSSSAP